MSLRLRLLGLSAIALLAAPAARAQTLDEILAKHYAAIGGLEQWQRVQSMKASGRITVGPGIEAPFTMILKRPLKMRMEFTFQGMTGVQAFDGEAGWMVMPFMGSPDPQPLPAEEAKNFQEEADIDGPLVNYAAKGHKVEFVGKEDVEGTPAYHLRITLKSGDVREYYLDAEHYLPIKAVGKRPIQGTEMEVETILGDYKSVGGLMVAHSIESRIKGTAQTQALTIDSIEWNVAVEDSLFVMPRKPGS